MLDFASSTQSSRGTGGMTSKLQAIRTATAVGESVILANGTTPGILDQILAGEEVGTLFLAKGRSLPAWKRWIGYSVPPGGRFVLDAGACRAVCENGRSLLAIGITAVEGRFDKGAIVSLVDAAGHELGRGLTNFSAAEVDANRRPPQPRNRDASWATCRMRKSSTATTSW